MTRRAMLGWMALAAAGALLSACARPQDAPQPAAAPRPVQPFFADGTDFIE